MVVENPVSMSEAKFQTYSQFAEIARVVGHVHRLELLELVAQGERSVERLAQLTNLSAANASQHLQQLRRVGLVRSRRDGKRILYRLGDGPILELLSSIYGVAERNSAELQVLISDYFGKRDDLEAVSRTELVDRMRRGEVMLLDVRPQDEFQLGHIPGARNIPLVELEERLAELPKDKEIVAYCRGAYCVLSFEAVAALRAKGYNIRRLEDGLPEWKASGFATGTAA